MSAERKEQSMKIAKVKEKEKSNKEPCPSQKENADKALRL